MQLTPEMPDQLIGDYRYCNFSDLYKSATARLYMAELVRNATENCKHLSCATTEGVGLGV